MAETELPVIQGNTVGDLLGDLHPVDKVILGLGGGEEDTLTKAELVVLNMRGEALATNTNATTELMKFHQVPLHVTGLLDLVGG